MMLCQGKPMQSLGVHVLQLLLQEQQQSKIYYFLFIPTFLVTLQPIAIN